jgi:hypothetical protein
MEFVAVVRFLQITAFRRIKPNFQIAIDKYLGREPSLGDRQRQRCGERQGKRGAVHQ